MSVDAQPPPPPPDVRDRPRIRALREEVRRGAANRPGVYRMLGPREEVLYVGKSVRLRSRLLSHLRTGPSAKGGHDLLRSTRRITWEELPDEFGALLRERRLIRRHRPRFNVLQKHEKRPLFIKLTREAAPRLLAVRVPRPDGSVYFGPLPLWGAAQRALRDLAHTVGLRDCPARTPIRFADQLDLLDVERTPLCLRAGLGSCPAPCAAGCGAGEYRERVHEARRFLESTSDHPLRTARARLERASGARDYELAAFLRDRIERLDRLRESLVRHGEEVATLSFLYRPPALAGARWIYLLRRGLVSLAMPDPEESDPGGSRALHEARERVARELAEPEPDPLRLGPEGGGEVLLVARWFRNRPEETRYAEEPLAWLRRTAGRAGAGSG